MNLISVIPLTRSKVAENLSYFTSSKVSIGSIVSVPLRSKVIHAIVVEIEAVEDVKARIKTAPFQIRKLDKVKAVEFFPTPFISTCKTLADYYATTVGAIIDAITSNTLLENAGKIQSPSQTKEKGIESIQTPASPLPVKESYAIQSDDEDRMGVWRSLIRQEFARKKSIALYVPTIEEAKNIAATLTKGIEGYIFVLHSGMTEKKLLETWKSIAETEHPVLVIATGIFSLLPRSDIETVIIERENGRGWISQKMPYLDFRHALETIALNERRTLYFADSLLRTETLHRIDGQKLSEGSTFKWRSVSTARDTLVSMIPKEIRMQDGTPPPTAKIKSFCVISPELEQLIQKNRDESTHLFIYAVRRGSSPITVCNDCETIVTCMHCSAPVVLHTSKESGRNFFMCHTCGERRSAHETCKRCGGWRLTPLGIGIDRVHQEIRAKFPDADIFQIDADSTKTDKEIKAVLESFRARPGSMLIGTELALLHLKDKVEHIAVASLDSLFALPDFRIPEKIMYTLIRLRTLSVRSILVQTRKPEEKVFEYGLKGNLSEFYHSTVSERKQFKYPPFSTLIKITIEGGKNEIADAMAGVVKLIAPYEVDIFPAFTATVKGNSVIHGLIKIGRGLWPHADLSAKLRSLPPSIKVKVDPESLL